MIHGHQVFSEASSEAESGVIKPGKTRSKFSRYLYFRGWWCMSWQFLPDMNSFLVFMLCTTFIQCYLDELHTEIPIIYLINNKQIPL